MTVQNIQWVFQGDHPQRYIPQARKVLAALLQQINLGTNLGFGVRQIEIAPGVYVAARSIGEYSPGQGMYQIAVTVLPSAAQARPKPVITSRDEIEIYPPEFHTPYLYVSYRYLEGTVGSETTLPPFVHLYVLEPVPTEGLTQDTGQNNKTLLSHIATDWGAASDGQDDPYHFWYTGNNYHYINDSRSTRLAYKFVAYDDMFGTTGGGALAYSTHVGYTARDMYFCNRGVGRLVVPDGVAGNYNECVILDPQDGAKKVDEFGRFDLGTANHAGGYSSGITGVTWQHQGDALPGQYVIKLRFGVSSYSTIEDDPLPTFTSGKVGLRVINGRVSSSRFTDVEYEIDIGGSNAFTSVSAAEASALQHTNLGSAQHDRIGDDPTDPGWWPGAVLVDVTGGSLLVGSNGSGALIRKIDALYTPSYGFGGFPY